MENRKPPGAPRGSWQQRWCSRRALLLHLAIVIWFPGCLFADYWQINIALSGDSLAWLYSVEWPLFALFGLYVWWHLVHDDPDSVGLRALRRIRELAEDPTSPPRRRVEEEDPELREYNDYLEELAQRPAHQGWRRR